MHYLRGTGAYARRRHRGAPPGPDPARPQHAQEGRPRGAGRDQGRPGAARHPRRRPDDLQGRGGHLPHLRPRRQLVRQQAGHLRASWPASCTTLACYWFELVELPQEGGRCAGAESLRILLVEDDEDDFVLTRSMLQAHGHARGSTWSGSRATTPALHAIARGAPRPLPRRLPARRPHRPGPRARRVGQRAAGAGDRPHRPGRLRGRRRGLRARRHRLPGQGHDRRAAAWSARSATRSATTR